MTAGHVPFQAGINVWSSEVKMRRETGLTVSEIHKV